VYHASSVAWVTKAASSFLNAVFSFYPEYRKNKGQIIEKITNYYLKSLGEKKKFLAIKDYELTLILN
jgi:hypothetical protein